MNEIMNIQGIPCYEKDGVAYLNLETVARGLGFTKKADSGNEVVNWTRVRGYLTDLGVEQKCTTGDYIPENIFYRLAMKAKNETAERFQNARTGRRNVEAHESFSFRAEHGAAVESQMSAAGKQSFQFRLFQSQFAAVEPYEK